MGSCLCIGGLCSLHPSLPQSKGSLYKNPSLSRAPTSPQSMKNIKLSQKRLFALSLSNSITVAVSQLTAVCPLSWQLASVEVVLVSCYIVQHEKSPILNASVIKNKTEQNKTRQNKTNPKTPKKQTTHKFH